MDRIINLVIAALLVLSGGSTLAGSGNRGGGKGMGGAAGMPGSEHSGVTSGRAGPSVKDISSATRIEPSSRTRTGCIRSRINSRTRIRIAIS